MLGEPDVPLSELGWPTFVAMVISLVRDTIEGVRSEEDWERATVGRDDLPREPVRRRQVRL